jgi:Protein of unknown function (DUF3150)
MNNQLLDGICQRGVLVTTTVRYWRGCKKLKPEDLGLKSSDVSNRLIRLGQKRLIPKDALNDFSLIESRAHAAVEGASFPFLGGIARFVPNPNLTATTYTLEKLQGEFAEATQSFVENYPSLREKALTEWREAAEHLNGSAERLLATIEQAFPPAAAINQRFSFEWSLFQISTPDSIRLELVDGVTQIEAAQDRQRIAAEATRRMQGDLDAFVRESVASLRQETARLASDVLATIDGSEKGVHQRTLNRIGSFIESFRTLNFAGDQQLEATLERFRHDLLNRSAEDYRNDAVAMGSLTDGLNRLRETAVQLVREDASDIVSRFGQVGQRRLAAVV